MPTQVTGTSNVFFFFRDNFFNPFFEQFFWKFGFFSDIIIGREQNNDMDKFWCETN